MNLSERIDELVNTGRYTLGQAIAQAVQEKAASVAATEDYAHGGVA